MLNSEFVFVLVDGGGGENTCVLKKMISRTRNLCQSQTAN